MTKSDGLEKGEGGQGRKTEPAAGWLLKEGMTPDRADRAEGSTLFERAADEALASAPSTFESVCVGRGSENGGNVGSGDLRLDHDAGSDT